MKNQYEKKKNNNVWKNLYYYKNKASNKLTDASKVDENSLKLDKVGPKSTSG